MHVVVFILAGLLILFGGGCTIVFLIVSIDEPRSFLADVPLLLSVWLPFGLAPLAGGIALWRSALAKKRRNAAPARANKEERR